MWAATSAEGYTFFVFLLLKIFFYNPGFILSYIEERFWCPFDTLAQFDKTQNIQCDQRFTFLFSVLYSGSYIRIDLWEIFFRGPFCLWTKKKMDFFLSTVPSFLVHKRLLTCSVYPLWPAQYPAVTRFVVTDKRQLLWCDLSKGRKNYISSKIRTESHFQHLADTLSKSDSQWVHGSNKIKFQGQKHFKQQERVDEPKLQHSDNRY